MAKQQAKPARVVKAEDRATAHANEAWPPSERSYWYRLLRAQARKSFIAGWKAATVTTKRRGRK